MSPQADMTVIRTAEQAAVLLDTTRLRLLKELANVDGDTAAGLSRRVGIKRQLVNYHLRELEKAGLLDVLAQTRRGNASERVVRAVARSFLIDPAVLGELSAHRAACEDGGSRPDLASVAAKIVSDLARLREARGTDEWANDLPRPTASMQRRLRFATAADREAFIEDATAEIAKLIAEYHDETSPQGRWEWLVMGNYPAVGDD